VAALPGSNDPETALFRYTHEYGGIGLQYELGMYMNVRFQEVPNNRFGLNKNVLYNCGAISKQYGVTQPIQSGAGAPDPDEKAVDEIWYVGQKEAVHYIQLESFGSTDFSLNDFVTIHTKRSDQYGVTDGVDPFDGRTIVRRVVDIDTVNHRLTFDRPIAFNYINGFVGKSHTAGVATTLYAYVTKGINVGFSLVLGSRGGVQGKVMRPLRFHEPLPIDDFQSVWRFVWQDIVGYNVADPNYFTLYFYNVSIPVPGGVA